MGSQIGGTWVYDNDNGRSFLYRSLHINTARELTRFRDFRFAADTPRFPDHFDMHRYPIGYADHFAVTSRIRLNQKVTFVRPLGPGTDGAARSRVETANGDGSNCDIVVVCTVKS